MTGVRSDVERAVGAYGPQADVYRAAGEWGGQTLVGVLRSHVESRPAAVAIATIEGELTYDDLDRRSDAMALGLVDAGLQPGDASSSRRETSWKLSSRCTVFSRRGLYQSAVSRTTDCTRLPTSPRRQGRAPTFFRRTTATTI